VEPLSSVEPLEPSHDTSTFDCGKPELTEWLRRYALVSHRAGSARVFVVHGSGRVVGYHALSAASVGLEETPARVRKGLARHPVPVIVLARLAVDQHEQGQGLGSGLLKDALIRASQASNEIGARDVLVHAKDEEARAFYERFDFEASPTDPFHLFLLMKDIKRALA
jgi:predicted N-acetyltransferase YhbS